MIKEDKNLILDKNLKNILKQTDEFIAFNTMPEKPNEICKNLLVYFFNNGGRIIAHLWLIWCTILYQKKQSNSFYSIVGKIYYNSTRLIVGLFFKKHKPTISVDFFIRQLSKKQESSLLWIVDLIIFSEDEQYQNEALVEYYQYRMSETLAYAILNRYYTSKQKYPYASNVEIIQICRTALNNKNIMKKLYKNKDIVQNHSSEFEAALCKHFLEYEDIMCFLPFITERNSKKIYFHLIQQNNFKTITLENKIIFKKILACDEIESQVLNEYFNKYVIFCNENRMACDIPNSFIQRHAEKGFNELSDYQVSILVNIMSRELYEIYVKALNTRAQLVDVTENQLNNWYLAHIYKVVFSDEIFAILNGEYTFIIKPNHCKNITYKWHSAFEMIAFFPLCKKENFKAYLILDGVEKALNGTDLTLLPLQSSNISLNNWRETIASIKMEMDNKNEKNIQLKRKLDYEVSALGSDLIENKIPNNLIDEHLLKIFVENYNLFEDEELNHILNNNLKCINKSIKLNINEDVLERLVYRYNLDKLLYIYINNQKNIKKIENIFVWWIRSCRIPHNDTVLKIYNIFNENKRYSEPLLAIAEQFVIDMPVAPSIVAEYIYCVHNNIQFCGKNTFNTLQKMVLIDIEKYNKLFVIKAFESGILKSSVVQKYNEWYELDTVCAEDCLKKYLTILISNENINHFILMNNCAKLIQEMSNKENPELEILQVALVIYQKIKQQINEKKLRQLSINKLIKELIQKSFLQMYNKKQYYDELFQTIVECLKTQPNDPRIINQYCEMSSYVYIKNMNEKQISVTNIFNNEQVISNELFIFKELGWSDEYLVEDRKQVRKLISPLKINPRYILEKTKKIMRKKKTTRKDLKFLTFSLYFYFKNRMIINSCQLYKVDEINISYLIRFKKQIWKILNRNINHQNQDINEMNIQFALKYYRIEKDDKYFIEFIENVAKEDLLQALKLLSNANIYTNITAYEWLAYDIGRALEKQGIEYGKRQGIEKLFILLIKMRKDKLIEKQLIQYIRNEKRLSSKHDLIKCLAKNDLLEKNIEIQFALINQLKQDKQYVLHKTVLEAFDNCIVPKNIKTVYMQSLINNVILPSKEFIIKVLGLFIHEASDIQKITKALSKRQFKVDDVETGYQIKVLADHVYQQNKNQALALYNMITINLLKYEQVITNAKKFIKNTKNEEIDTYLIDKSYKVFNVKIKKRPITIHMYNAYDLAQNQRGIVLEFLNNAFLTEIYKIYFNTLSSEVINNIKITKKDKYFRILIKNTITIEKKDRNIKDNLALISSYYETLKFILRAYGIKTLENYLCAKDVELICVKNEIICWNIPRYLKKSDIKSEQMTKILNQESCDSIRKMFNNIFLDAESEQLSLEQGDLDAVFSINDLYWSLKQLERIAEFRQSDIYNMDLVIQDFNQIDKKRQTKAVEDILKKNLIEYIKIVLDFDMELEKKVAFIIESLSKNKRIDNETFYRGINEINKLDNFDSLSIREIATLKIILDQTEKDQTVMARTMMEIYRKLETVCRLQNNIIRSNECGKTAKEIKEKLRKIECEI